LKKALIAIGVVLGSIGFMVGGVAQAKSAPPTFATVLKVRIDRHDPRVAYVTAIYRCTAVQAPAELWVSVKQVESRRRDPALLEEGSSQISAAWSDSHRNPINCNSKVHIGTFTVDQQEPYFTEAGPTGQKSDIYEPLARGWGYVQFCLFDDQYPATGNDPSTLAPFSDMRFHLVL
jgi:hypothetical protein